MSLHRVYFAQTPHDGPASFLVPQNFWSLFETQMSFLPLPVFHTQTINASTAVQER